MIWLLRPKKKDINNNNNNPSFSLSLLSLLCPQLVDNGKFFLTLTTHIQSHTFINITEDGIVKLYHIKQKKSSSAVYLMGFLIVPSKIKSKEAHVLIVLTYKCPSTS